MVIRQLDHLNLTVHKLDSTLEFYERMFGFEKVEEGNWDGVPWMILRAGDAMLCMYEHPDYVAPSEGTHGVSHFGLRVSDEATWRQTVEREAPRLLFGGVVSWPHSTAWYVADPTGNIIEVVAWKGDVVRF